MSLRSGDERGGVADRCELGGECGGWADAANWRILAAGLLSPQEAGRGRRSFPLPCLLSRDSAVNRYPRIFCPNIGVHFNCHIDLFIFLRVEVNQQSPASLRG